MLESGLPKVEMLNGTALNFFCSGTELARVADEATRAIRFGL